MAVIFGIDCASYQGSVNWATVDRVCEFGWEKVSEGLSYVNPYWNAAKIGMKARAAATGFVPGCYLFLDAGDGARQADHFASAAGNLDGFAVAIDVERSNGNPTLSQAKAAVARLRQYYPKHPIGGYIPKWYWSESLGSASLTWVDWLWQSSYVSGSGSPTNLYEKVPSSMWAAFGGKTPTLLQFSSSASVAGVAGQVDVSAYRGTTAQLRALAVGGATPAPTTEDDVPYRSSYGLTKAQPVAWNTQVVLDWDVENADPAKAHSGDNPGYVSPLGTWADMDVTLTIDGLDKAKGDEYQIVFIVHDWNDKTGKATSTWTECVADVPATSGHNYATGRFSKGLSKNQHVYVAVTCFPGDSDTKRTPPKVTEGRWAIAQDKQ